ncbi:E3 ubiquitin-protein ligase MARCHF2 [Ixodes scapularis]|uniref:E3 ubiquitin-protein ligase MARCHF2 n=1 Tax=Ixodes scapularis TaxID=6945 RepID=UPI001A9CD79E|nr:E3 ubiquitin-protein ligase MARCHF2 [Ixodes scapularis]
MEDNPPPNEHQQQSTDSSRANEPVCRICYRRSDTEQGGLIAPCCCKGSIGLTHQSCMERWLRERNTEQCDVCLHRLKVLRKPQPLRRFFAEADHRRDIARMVLNLVTCVGDFMVLTFAWLYASGYLRGKGWLVYVLLIAALFVQTAFWIAVAIIRAWTCYEPIRKWRKRTATVKLLVQGSQGASSGTDLATAEEGSVSALRKTSEVTASPTPPIGDQ